RGVPRTRHHRRAQLLRRVPFALVLFCCHQRLLAANSHSAFLRTPLGRLAREYCEQSKNGLEEKLQIVPLPSLHEESCATEPRSCPLQIQSLLLDIGSNVATPRNAADADARLRMFVQQDQTLFAVAPWFSRRGYYTCRPHRVFR